ncbi:MAG: hypothetical protein FJY85_20080, partial [Deltaproteobacteria bacterium]|nr:hypothetical protein [Deltaproteobacteria bacterium]
SPTVPDLTVSRDVWNSYRITGDFEFNRDYVLRVKAVPVRSGSAVMVAKEFPFKGPGLKSEVVARTSRSTVELVGRQLFPLTLSNVSKVQCRLTRVPPYLIPDAASAVRGKASLEKLGLKKKSEELKRLTDSGKVDAVFAGEPIEDSEVFFAPEAKDNVFGYSVPLSFRSQPEKGGAWVVTLSDPDTGFSDTVPAVVHVTDLALSYKISEKSLLVWVTSIHSGDPVAGVEVLMFQADGTRLFVGKTNKEGLLVVADGKGFPSIVKADKAPEAVKTQIQVSAVTWIVAATSSDACGVPVDSVRLKPSGVTQTKQVRDQPDSIRGYVFTERGVYRPGETVHFKYVSRAYKVNKIAVPEGEKVQVEIIGPRQDVHFSKVMSLGEFGTCHDAMPTQKFFPVGTYTITV